MTVIVQTSAEAGNLSLLCVLQQPVDGRKLYESWRGRKEGLYFFRKVSVLKVTCLNPGPDIDVSV